jgi:hypothetical protein
VTVDKTKYMNKSRDQNAGRSQHAKIDDSSFESVDDFKYLRKILAHNNSILEIIKR